MGSARRARDSDAGGKAQPLKEAQQTFAETRLAAEQVGGAGKVQPNAIAPR